eukprot:15377734-Alexandrium_andersonii.AAC.1
MCIRDRRTPRVPCGAPSCAPPWSASPAAVAERKRSFEVARALDGRLRGRLPVRAGAVAALVSGCAEDDLK